MRIFLDTFLLNTHGKNTELVSPPVKIEQHFCDEINIKRFIEIVDFPTPWEHVMTRMWWESLPIMSQYKNERKGIDKDCSKLNKTDQTTNWTWNLKIIFSIYTRQLPWCGASNHGCRSLNGEVLVNQWHNIHVAKISLIRAAKKVETECFFSNSIWYSTWLCCFWNKVIVPQSGALEN